MVRAIINRKDDNDLEFNKYYNKILVVDGSYMIHRSLHVDSVFNLKNSKGERTGGIFGFLRSISAELKNCGDYFPIICWDDGLAHRRTEIDPHYKKANERESDNTVLTPEELDSDYVTQYRKQRNRLIELLSYFGIPSLKFKGWEGDDLMYILTRISNKSLVLTDDRDLLQLLSPSCKVRRPMADENWDLETFVESRGFDSIYDFVLYKAIIGDGSDNIPKSCKGVGESSINDFIKLLHHYHKENIWDFSGYPTNIEDMKLICEVSDVKYKKTYLNFDKNRFLMNLELVDLNCVTGDIDERILDSIITTVSNCKSGIDYFKAIKSLSSLEIKEFSTDSLMESVNMRYRNLIKEKCNG